ncbi:uncharacterized protein LOC121748114 [Salvia splendens]|uniref:uncharacterized protein LOC121748114 n=1 Tax=Salvia splendens TaxID=180675 RepID=UPI001C27FFBF|nr:uncharacterized protein LOC121748114 [Salvia splendens]
MTMIFHIPCDSRVVRTTVTSVPSVDGSTASTAYRRGRLVAGLGVQWVSGHAATLQICVGSRCLIFQLHHADLCPDVLRGFLLDSNVIRGHADELAPRSPGGLARDQLRGCVLADRRRSWGSVG